MPVDAATTRRARIYMRWFDHEILRHVWTNQAEIAPGVYRSNQPTLARLERLRAAGIKTVLCLRGDNTLPYAAIRGHCDQLGMRLAAVGLSARQPPTAESILCLIDLFRTMERPFVMHCKSGADRAGLASAIYLIVIEGKSVTQARRMFCWRYIHFKRTKTGVLDRFLEAYARDGAGMPLEAWVRDRYDPNSIT